MAVLDPVGVRLRIAERNEFLTSCELGLEADAAKERGAFWTCICFGRKTDAETLVDARQATRKAQIIVGDFMVFWLGLVCVYW
jgi:hypothetical protein